MLEPCLSFHRTPSIHSRPTRGASAVEAIFGIVRFAAIFVLQTMFCMCRHVRLLWSKWRPTVRHFVPCSLTSSNSGWFRNTARRDILQPASTLQCVRMGCLFERLPFHIYMRSRAARFQWTPMRTHHASLEPLNATTFFEWASIRKRVLRNLPVHATEAFEWWPIGIRMVAHSKCRGE